MRPAWRSDPESSPRDGTDGTDGADGADGAGVATTNGAVTRAVMETIASSAAAAAYAVFANLLDACAAETASVQAHGVSNAVGIRSPGPFALSAAVPQSGRRFRAEI